MTPRTGILAGPRHTRADGRGWGAAAGCAGVSGRGAAGCGAGADARQMLDITMPVQAEFIDNVQRFVFYNIEIAVVTFAVSLESDVYKRQQCSPESQQNSRVIIDTEVLRKLIV